MKIGIIRKSVRLLLCLLCLFSIGSMRVPAASGDESSMEPGMYEILPVSDPEMCIDLKTCTVRSEEEMAGDETLGSVQLYVRQDVNQQKYYFERQSDGSFAITNLAAGKNLTAGEMAEDEEGNQYAPVTCRPIETISGQTSDSESADPDSNAETDGSAAEGEHAGNASAGGADPADVMDTQKWTVGEDGNGGWYIRNENGLYLTFETERACNGTSLSLRTFTGNQNQRWYFQKTRLSQTDCADTDHSNPYAEHGLYSSLKIRVRTGKSSVYLDAEKICEWVSETDAHTFELSSDAITAFIQSLADSTDTQGVPRKFVTHGGSEITLYKGNFGWKTDVEASAALLRETVEAGKNTAIDLIWEQTGKGWEKGNDIGDSYVEISLAEQHLWLFLDGKEILSTDVVTGTYGTDRQTPGGVYALTFKQSPAVLHGADYETAVNYWMPFNGNIGMHDATWRSDFGGDIFRTDGSHGCVNLPLDAAKTIYEHVEQGFPVVLYN